jgi:hypothetical protein
VRMAVLGSAAWTFGGERPIAERRRAIPHEHALAAQWDKDRFAEEQVRGLVGQIFSPNLKPAVQQVLFCAVEAETDVLVLCRWVGEILAEDGLREVALVDEEVIGAARGPNGDGQDQSPVGSIRQFGTRIHRNLWLLPSRRTVSDGWKGSLSAYLNEVRQEFEYSIVSAPAPTVSSKALEMATSADGVVLVLSAQRTRRVMALKVRSALSHVRLLGTVLSDREFPMPTSIYRRL